MQKVKEAKWFFGPPRKRVDPAHYLVELVDVLVACKPPGPVLYMRVGKDVPPSSTEPRMFDPRSG